MSAWIETECTAFEGSRRIAQGPLRSVALAAKAVADQEGPLPILIFNERTSAVIEVDFRGASEDVAHRLEERSAAMESEAVGTEVRRPGRPKLGVVGREVTLLPRHWEWLSAQPGGASVALRKLVETARKANRDKDRIRHSQESC